MIKNHGTETLLKVVSGKHVWLKKSIVKDLTTKKFRPKSPTAVSLTLTSLSKRLTLIFWQSQPDEKSRDTEHFKNDESICKTVLVKYYDNEFYGKIPTIKSPWKKRHLLVNSKHFLGYVDEINSYGALS